MNKPDLDLKNISKCFKGQSGFVSILKSINLQIHSNQILALVGPSGSGKTTLARILARLTKPSAGELIYAPTSNYKGGVRLVFQNPFESLTPHMTISNILLDSYDSSEKTNLQLELNELFDRLKLSRGHLNAYPHELSGGEAQRVALVRALLNKPKLLICDEILSGIDTVLQKEILDLLKELQLKLGFSILWITHDLITAHYFCNEIAVLYDGEIVEYASSNSLMKSPKHSYTKELIKAMHWILS